MAAAGRTRTRPHRVGQLGTAADRVQRRCEVSPSTASCRRRMSAICRISSRTSFHSNATRSKVEQRRARGQPRGQRFGARLDPRRGEAALDAAHRFDQSNLESRRRRPVPVGVRPAPSARRRRVAPRGAAAGWAEPRRESSVDSGPCRSLQSRVCGTDRSLTQMAAGPQDAPKAASKPRCKPRARRPGKAPEEGGRPAYSDDRVRGAALLEDRRARRRGHRPSARRSAGSVTTSRS